MPFNDNQYDEGEFVNSHELNNVCMKCESLDKIKDCMDCMINTEMENKIIKFKTEMIKEAQAKHQNRVIKPCSEKKSLWNCFIIYGPNEGFDEGLFLHFTYNIGKGTYVSKRQL